MSDEGRKGFGQELKEKVTPQSEKGPLDKAKETVTSKGDQAAGKAQPDSEKGVGQKIKDAVTGK